MKGSNIVVHNTIIHYLNKETDKLILTDYENTSNVELVKDFKKIFKSVSKNEYSRKGVFEDYENNQIRKYAEEIIYDESTFISNSKKIAELLYETMQIHESIESGCLLVGLFTVDDEKQVGIFKVNFKKSYSKEIKQTESNKFKMNMVKRDDLLPENMSTTQSAIIYASGVNDEYHLLVLDKKPEKEQLDSDFIQKFLNVRKVQDDVFKTKMIKETMDTFITNAFGDDVKYGEGVRSLLAHTLINEDTITPNELIETLIDDPQKRESIIEILEEKMDDLNDEVEVDKEWIDKKFKKRIIKTDTGFILRGDFSDFEDPTKYSLSKNSDGSVNITLKNIKIFE